MDDGERAKIFAELLCDHHTALLHGDDQRMKEAVIVKMVALVALAFSIPPVDDEPLDIEDTIGKLLAALAQIAQ